MVRVRDLGEGMSPSSRKKKKKLSPEDAQLARDRGNEMIQVLKSELKKPSPEELEALQDAIATELAYDRARAWALSVPGTPYGSTNPNLSAEMTPYESTHRHEYPNC